MIATQGHGGEPILQYVERFEVQYSLDGTNWMNVTEDGTGTGTAQVRTNVVQELNDKLQCVNFTLRCFV